MKSNFLIALTQLAAERNLDRDTILSAVEEALSSTFKKESLKSGQNISVKLDTESGEFNVWVVKTVVKTVEDTSNEISLADAKKIKDLDTVPEIGSNILTGKLNGAGSRIEAQTAKQVILQRLREAEKELIFNEFQGREGEIFSVTVVRVDQKKVYVEMGRAEGLLPAHEQMYSERYRVGQKFRVLLKEISDTPRGPELIVSRADTILLQKLFEQEVPEISNGSVDIMTIAREAGNRSKVSVVAKQEGIDAVGSCVGLRGIRIQSIVSELQGEKIDVVEWSNDPKILITSSLNPAQVTKVELNEDDNVAVVWVPNQHLSLAIGKEGQNARLAAKMTDWKIDIRSVEPEEKSEEENEKSEKIFDPGLGENVFRKTVEEEIYEEEIYEEVAEEVVEEVTEEVTEEVAEEITEETVAEEVTEEITEETVAEEVTEETVVEEVTEETVVEEVTEEAEEPAINVKQTKVKTEEEELTTLRDADEDLFSIEKLFGTTDNQNQIRFAEDIDEIKSKSNNSSKKPKNK